MQGIITPEYSYSRDDICRGLNTRARTTVITAATILVAHLFSINMLFYLPAL